MLINQKNFLHRIIVLLCICAVSIWVAFQVKNFLAMNDMGLAYSTKDVPVIFMLMIMMILMWVTEIFPLWFTACMPIIVVPLFGLMSVSQLAPMYYHEVSFLFLSGFLMGEVIAQWNLHVWLSRKVLSWTKGHLMGIWMAFVFIAYFLSMWMANVVAALMLMSVSEGLISELKALVPEERWKSCEAYATTLVLSIAFASSIGGIATLIGTAPNALLSCFLLDGASPVKVDMLSWFVHVAPLSLILMCALVIFMYLCYLRFIPHDLRVITLSHKRQPSLTQSQIMVIVVFFLVVCMWMGKQLLQHVLHLPVVSDAWIGMLGVGLLNLFPSDRVGQSRLMNEESIRRIPWDILILIGGGMCLAKMMSLFNVDKLMTSLLSQLPLKDPILLIGFAIVFMTIMTEITSNTAITMAALPIFYSLARVNDVNVLALLVPVTVSASMAFMLPTATPPNAVAFATGYVSMTRMLKIGGLFKFVAVGICLIYFCF